MDYFLGKAGDLIVDYSFRPIAKFIFNHICRGILLRFHLIAIVKSMPTKDWQQRSVGNSRISYRYGIVPKREIGFRGKSFFEVRNDSEKIIPEVKVEIRLANDSSGLIYEIRSLVFLNINPGSIARHVIEDAAQELLIRSGDIYVKHSKFSYILVVGSDSYKSPVGHRMLDLQKAYAEYFGRTYITTYLESSKSDWVRHRMIFCRIKDEKLWTTVFYVALLCRLLRFKNNDTVPDLHLRAPGKMFPDDWVDSF